jgi:broad specificity phosphatase PhoE
MFRARVAAAFERLVAEHDGRTVVAVSHGGFIVASFLALLAVANDDRRARLDPTHTSLTEWERDGGPWRLVRYNDAAHLVDPALRTQSTFAI